MKRVLLTGATGFVGRHCLAPLRKRGFEVHAVRHARPPEGAAEGIHWHEADLLAPGTPRRLVAEVAPSHLLHVAWIATPGVFWTSPKNAAWLAASRELVDAFCSGGGARLVGVGSCAEYAAEARDCHETRTPLDPPTAYGQAKLALARMVAGTAPAHGTSAAWARVFFPYGPGEAAGRLAPTVFTALSRGETVALSHGNQVRDLLFVEDVADALATLLDSPVEHAINVGSGTPVTLRAFVEEIARQFGGLEQLRFGARPAPADEPQRVVADVTRLRDELGWRPRFDLPGGVARSVRVWQHPGRRCG